MKPSTSAFIGAIVVTSGWMSLPAVAFAGESRSSIAAPSSPSGDTAAASDAAVGGTCRADTHARSSTCNCARCSAARAE